jgi:hypothetical protein
MDILEQFLHNIAYKFHKGYPDLTDENDIVLLENEFKKIGIDLNELELTPHYIKRKKERKYILDIPNLNQQMIGDRDFKETKSQIIDNIEKELISRLSNLENIRTVPLSFKETVIYKILKPILLSNGEKYDLLFTTESTDERGNKKLYTDKFYYAIISNDDIKTLMGGVGNDDDIEKKSIDFLKTNNYPLKDTKILTFGDFEYLISLDGKSDGKKLIDPASLPYKLRTDYRKGADFEHKDYGKGTIVTTSSGNSGKGDNRGKLEWVEVDFGKPYVSGGAYKTTRVVKNIYTSLSPDIDTGAAE